MFSKTPLCNVGHNLKPIGFSTSASFLNALMFLTRGNVMLQKSQRTHKPDAPRRRPVLETTGEVFSDGTLLELASDASSADKLGLLCWDGKEAKAQDRVELADRTYVPFPVNASTLRAIRFPNQTRDYGSTSILFGKLVDLLDRYFVLPERDLILVALWVLTTWFPDVLPMAPTLVISGPSPAYVSCFLRLLKCICRRGIRLAELNPAGLCALPMRLQPTLLVEQTALTRSMRGLFRASSSRGVYITRSGDFLDLHCAQALFSAENGLDAAVNESTLHVAVVPAASGSASLNERAEDEIAAELQPMLLGYRLRNHRAVSESTFDLPEFTPGLRELAHSLGAAIVGDAELAGRIPSLLAPQDADARARRSVLPEGAILTVALALIHEGKLKKMLTGALTPLVNAALRAKGEVVEFSPEEVGWRLSRLGLYTHRMAGGNGIRFDREFSRAVHNLARRFGVEISPTGSPECPDCQEAAKITDPKGVA